MANAVYNNVKLLMAGGGLNLASDTLKIMLVTSSYTPNIDTHTVFTDITNEATGTGYTAGGATLAGKAINIDLVNDRAYFDANDVTWATASITARGAVIYKDTGTPATSPLITYLDFGSDKTAAGGDFAIAFDATGILRIQ